MLETIDKKLNLSAELLLVHNLHENANCWCITHFFKKNKTAFALLYNQLDTYDESKLVKKVMTREFDLGSRAFLTRYSANGYLLFV